MQIEDPTPAECRDAAEVLKTMVDHMRGLSMDQKRCLAIAVRVLLEKAVTN